MKKKTIQVMLPLCLLAVGSLSGLSAQTQVENSNFEEFSIPPGSSQSYQIPTHWNNINNGNLSGFASVGARQNTVGQSAEIRPGSEGNSSVKITTRDLVIAKVNGTLTTGQMVAPDATPTHGYNITITGDEDFSQAFEGRPDLLSVWVKYSVTSNKDSARVSAYLHDDYALRDPNDEDSKPHVIAHAVKNFQTSGNWKRLIVPFNYEAFEANDAGAPAYMLLTLTSSYNPGNGVKNAELLADDLEMIYNVGVAVSGNDQTLHQNEEGTALEASVTMDGDGEYADSKEGLVSAWQWKYGTSEDGPFDQPIRDASAETYVPSFEEEGTYYVVAEATFGEAGSDNSFTIQRTSNPVKITVEGVLGVNDAALEQFSFGPNPVGDQLTLKAQEKIDQVEIYDMNGNQVLRTAPGTTSAQINTSGLTAGVYILKVTSSGKTRTSKLVKK